MPMDHEKSLLIESFYKDKNFRKFKKPIKFCPGIKINFFKFIDENCDNLINKAKESRYCPFGILFAIFSMLICILWQIIEKISFFFLNIFILKITYFNNRNSDSVIITRSFVFTMISLPLIAFYVHKVLTYIFLDIECIKSKFTFMEILVSNIYYSESNQYFFTLWIPVFSLIYWSLRKRFSDQWTYCAELYNRTSFGMDSTKSDGLAVSYQRATLALDLLQTDLYAHKSFYSTFNIVLEKSIRYLYAIKDTEVFKEIDDSENIFCIKRDPNDVESEIQRFINGNASCKQAGFYISKFQNDLDDNLIEEILAS